MLVVALFIVHHRHSIATPGRDSSTVLVPAVSNLSRFLVSAGRRPMLAHTAPSASA